MGKLLPLIALLLISLPARADQGGMTYAPGTVGYLYDDCRKALAESKSYSQLQQTYCGAFGEGYFWGAAAASGGMKLETDPDDPCAEEKQREFDRINNRVCQNFPRPDWETFTTGDALQEVISIVTRWIDFEKSHSPGDPMKRGMLREVNNLIRPGPFCEDLKKSYAAQESPFVLNPGLVKMNLGDFMQTASSMTMTAKYARCKKDVAEAGDDPAKFLGTRCGAEISGYISGLHSADHLQKNRLATSSACKKPIDRLYKNLDVTKTMCVTYDTNPLRVAEIFVQKFPDLHVPQTEVGGIGQLIIYRGFLCADRAAGD